MNYFGEHECFIIDTYVRTGLSFGPRLQQSLQVVFLFDGSMSIWVDGVVRHLVAGDATLLLPGHTEYFEYSQAPPAYHGWCQAHMVRLDHETLLAYRKVPTVVRFSERIFGLIEMGIRVGKDPDPRSHPLFKKISETIFLDFFLSAGFPPTDAPPIPGSINRVLYYIHDHFAEDCNLTLLSKIACTSSKHLVRLFKIHLGSTPIDYLWEFRAEEAIRMLKETGLNIAEIAYKTGFKNPYHFSRSIKKRYGISPKDIRNRHWKKPLPISE